MKLFAFNALCATVFLVLAVSLWAQPEVADIPGAGAGDPLIWGLFVLPIFLLCLLVDLVVLCHIVIAGLRRKSIRFSRWHVATPVLWAAVLYVDYSHHWAV